MDTAFDLLGHSHPFPQRRDASPRKCAAGLRASWRPEALGQVDTTHGCSSVIFPGGFLPFASQCSQGHRSGCRSACLAVMSVLPKHCLEMLPVKAMAELGNLVKTVFVQDPIYRPVQSGF